MGDQLQHECGLALVRLRQPLSHYRQKYGDPAWGLRRVYLLMEKQHNRGQDGAGLCTVKFDMPPGERFMLRVRSDRNNALERVFDTIMRGVNAIPSRAVASCDDLTFKRRCEFLGELYLGHLRYGTHSSNQRINCHPLIRENNTASRNLALAGNFNMTNSAELFMELVEFGLNPTGESDTQVILERLGFFLDREHELQRSAMGPDSFVGLRGRELAREVSAQLNLVRVLTRAAEGWDGGYVFAGLVGNGDCFVCRDPAGIRPGFFHVDDDVVAVASERAALASVFDVDVRTVCEIPPGEVLVVKRSGEWTTASFTPPIERRQCAFERIYFSRGNDPDIYHERKALGRSLAPRVLESLGGDLEHAVFSFVPNTAEAAYYGLVDEIGLLERRRRAEAIARRAAAGENVEREIHALANVTIRAEKVAHKDQRLRTFITHDSARRDLVLHIYDITRGVVGPEDTLVVLDDSIVRGTTLRESIITILSRLNPARILVLSSAPPIFYPDTYGIDMSQLGRFIAFEAAISLLRDRAEESLLDEIEAACVAQEHLPADRHVNHLARLYGRFSLEEISSRVAQLVRPRNIPWHGRIDVIYQSIDGLQAAMPEHTGDWYFTGRYPTPGGYRVLSRAFLNWRRSLDVRAY